MAYEPLSEPLVKNLLTMARGYIKANDKVKKKIKLSSVSRLCHGDPVALDNLAKGKGSMSLRKYDDCMEWLHGNWPEGAPIPVLPFDIRAIAAAA